MGLTGQELALLGFGLLAGLAGGMVLTTAFRRRSDSSPTVRLTVTPAVLSGRPSATLVGGGQDRASAPARGGPGDPAWSTVAAPSAPAGDGIDRTGVRESEALVPVPVSAGIDPLLEALRTRRPSAVAVLERPGTAIAAATAEAHGAPGSPADHPDGPSVASGAVDPVTAQPAADAGPCAELKVTADERCEVASRARVEADRALETLRAAQRSYDDHQARAEDASRAADPRSIRAAKDAAQEAFRHARAVAQSAEAVDAAARDWLTEVNRINQEQRAAAAAGHREQEAARALASSLDRLTVEADAARIAAETADESCLAARQAVADCEEAELPTAAAGPPAPAVPSGAPPAPWLGEVSEAEGAGTALGSGTAPTVFWLLQGDREILADVVGRLAGDDPGERRRWQLAMSDLIDAILATAIEGSALEFPEAHPFWGPFTLDQSRDIVRALASLGYRFDGLGGWQDSRVPSQRDLSLALGYAGLDPMRMRHWPNEAQMAGLFQEVRVAAADYLATSAGDLTLGELVTMLGPRADGLTDVWNAWGRIRPLLLEER